MGGDGEKSFREVSRSSDVEEVNLSDPLEPRKRGSGYRVANRAGKVNQLSVVNGHDANALLRAFTQILTSFGTLSPPTPPRAQAL